MGSLNELTERSWVQGHRGQRRTEAFGGGCSLEWILKRLVEGEKGPGTSSETTMAGGKR